MGVAIQQQHGWLSHGSITLAVASKRLKQKTKIKRHTAIFRWSKLITSSFKDSIMEIVIPLCRKCQQALMGSLTSCPGPTMATIATMGDPWYHKSLHHHLLSF